MGKFIFVIPDYRSWRNYDSPTSSWNRSARRSSAISWAGARTSRDSTSLSPTLHTSSRVSTCLTCSQKSWLEISTIPFADFLIDDILQTNPLGRCEQLILKDVSLTLVRHWKKLYLIDFSLPYFKQISALRLISSRPKLRSIGRLMKWDVEPSELDTFAQILRKANGMKLLQDINIVWRTSYSRYLCLTLLFVPTISIITVTACEQIIICYLN